MQADPTSLIVNANVADTRGHTPACRTVKSTNRLGTAAGLILPAVSRGRFWSDKASRRFTVCGAAARCSRSVSDLRNNLSIRTVNSRFPDTK